MKKLDSNTYFVARGECSWQQALIGIDRIFAPAVGCIPICYTDDLEDTYGVLSEVAEGIEGNFPRISFTLDGYPSKIIYQSCSGSSGLVWAGGKYALWALPGSNTLRQDYFLADKGLCHLFAVVILPDEDRAGLLAL